MFNLFRRISKNFRANFGRIAFEGVFFTVLLFLVAIILLSNLVRVLSNGRRNYEIYLQEKNSLEEIKYKNQELTYISEITKTDEYLIILARDVWNLAFRDENLVTIKDEREFYEVKLKLLEVDKKEDYRDWWSVLFR